MWWLYNFSGKCCGGIQSEARVTLVSFLEKVFDYIMEHNLLELPFIVVFSVAIYFENIITPVNAVREGTAISGESVKAARSEVPDKDIV